MKERDLYETKTDGNAPCRGDDNLHDSGSYRQLTLNEAVMDTLYKVVLTSGGEYTYSAFLLKEDGLVPVAKQISGAVTLIP